MTIQYQPSNRLSGFSKLIWKTKWATLLLFAGLLALTSCGSDAAEAVQEESSDQLTEATNETSFARAAALRPFSFTDDLAGETFTVENPSQSTTFTTESGTTITIPANTLVDEQGDLVSGPVKIRYREFRNAAEIISSGIPMTVQGGHDETEWMQTAGMFEIRAFQNGQAVEIATDKSIEVGFISPVDGAYDAWVLDDNTNEWTNLGAGADPVEIPVEDAQLNTINEEIEALTAKTAVAPEKPTYEKQNEIRIDDPANLNQFPELRDARSHLFVYAGKDASKAPKKNPWIRDKDWSRYELAPGPKSGVYAVDATGRRYGVFSFSRKSAPAC